MHRIVSITQLPLVHGPLEKFSCDIQLFPQKTGGCPPKKVDIAIELSISRRFCKLVV